MAYGVDWSPADRQLEPDRLRAAQDSEMGDVFPGRTRQRGTLTRSMNDLEGNVGVDERAVLPAPHGPQRYAANRDRLLQNRAFLFLPISRNSQLVGDESNGFGMRAAKDGIRRPCSSGVPGPSAPASWRRRGMHRPAAGGNRDPPCQVIHSSSAERKTTRRCPRYCQFAVLFTYLDFFVYVA